jgi:hypothetical protein
MEKARGIGVDTKWLHMTKRERHMLASSFVEIEKQFFDIRFAAIGSIYFKSDIPSHLQAPLYADEQVEKGDAAAEEYCIGPTVDYMFWYGKPAGLDLYRGPCALPTPLLSYFS